MWIYRFNNGELAIARRLAEKFSEVAHVKAVPADILAGDRLTGSTLHYAGEQAKALFYLERVVRLDIGPGLQRHAMWFHYDQHVMALSRLSRVSWLRGRLDEAVELAQRAVAHARAIDHTPSLCFALGEAACPVATMVGDLSQADCSIEILLDSAIRHNFSFWISLARCFEARLLIKRGEHLKGSSLLSSWLPTLARRGQALHYSGFAGDLAEGLAADGRITDATSTIQATIERSERDGVHWCIPELLRIKGELVMHATTAKFLPTAEMYFLKAIEMAREQDALFWELRIATSLARLKIYEKQKSQAKRILSRVYRKFERGLDSEDLRATRALLSS
jgi:hypothetical protein